MGKNSKLQKKVFFVSGKSYFKMAKIGRNDPCPCGSGKKYKKCCLEKGEIQKEVNAFVEQMLDNFEKRANAKWRGSFLENPIRRNFASLYLQCKYISEKFNKTILLDNKPNEKEHWIIYRKSTLIKKLIWNPTYKNVKGKKIFLQWGKHKEGITPEEYIDLIIDTFSSIFEYYVSLLRKRKLFDTLKLAQSLGLNHLTSKIDNIDSLKELYDKLSEEVKKEYGSQEIKSLFNMKAYKVKCASSHNDYSFKRDKNGSFSISLEGGRDSINFTGLLQMSNDIMAELNGLITIPYLFRKGVLPAK